MWHLYVHMEQPGKTTFRIGSYASQRAAQGQATRRQQVSDRYHLGKTYFIEQEPARDSWTERNPEAELAEIRSEYRYEDDSRYQMDDAEIAYRAEMASEQARVERIERGQDD